MPRLSNRNSLPLIDTKIIKKRLIDHLYDALKRRIADLSLGLGTRIDVNQIASKFGVSGSPVRSALNRLTHEGLVKMIPRRGYFVVSLAGQDIREIYDVRITLETYAIQKGVLDQAAKKQLQGVLHQLKSLAENFESPEAENKSLQADKALHHGIMKMCRNKRIRQFYFEIDAFAQVIQSAFQTIHKRQVVQEHIDMLKHLLKGDKDQAIKCLTKHLENAMKRNLEVLAAKNKLGISIDYEEGQHRK